ncbi:MAG: hypothetical protein GY859_35545, partial [Desulfobacterales bacterium]|nr:hypothetical protein [Desulfobacterales bacterium]
MDSLRFTTNIPRIDFFRPEIWEPGALERELDRCLAIPIDPYASGRWRLSGKSRGRGRYKETLGGRAVESFDPNGFLSWLGLSETLTAGRTNLEMLRAFHLAGDYTPDSRYSPFRGKGGDLVRKFFLWLSRLAPRVVYGIDALVTRLVIGKPERRPMAGPDARNWCGRMEDILGVVRFAIPREARYSGVARKKASRWAWANGVHVGSVDPDHENAERFGTYDIALNSGFTDSQARRIAKACYDVDFDATHYADPDNREKPRATRARIGTGDLFRHYNRSPKGVEDTRIMAARIHFDRAVKLADKGCYDAAERELGVGLHGLQDMFSHVQTTPVNHVLLGAFPDLVRYHPLAMYETAVVTEGWFNRFIERLNLKPMAPLSAPRGRPGFSGRVVAGNASREKRALAAAALERRPAALFTFLRDNRIQIFVGAEGEELNGPEREDPSGAGREREGPLAAYHHQDRMIFLSARAMEDPGFDAILKHEIHHAMDLTLMEHPRLKKKWKAYIHKLYNAARKEGSIGFCEFDPHEYFAGPGK